MLVKNGWLNLLWRYLRSERGEVGEPPIEEPPPPPVETPPNEPPETPPAETPPLEDENKEPGGSDPQAVRARKEYRGRKAAEQRLQTQTQELIRAQERTRLLEEQAQKKAEPEKKVFTPAEVQIAVDKGEISQAEGTAYLIETAIERRVQGLREEEARAQPIKTATTELQGYIAAAPELADATSDNFVKVRTEYQRLVSLGFPADIRSQLVAVEKVLGPLDRIKSRHETARLTRETIVPHNETPAGGNNANKSKLDLSKAPTSMKEYWERTKLPEKSRIKELTIYNQLKERQRQRSA